MCTPIVARQRPGKIPLTVAKQRIGKKRYRGNEHIRNNINIVGRVVFYTVRVVSSKAVPCLAFV
jgi:hypothetical protein